MTCNQHDPDPMDGPDVGPDLAGSTLSQETRRVYAGAWQAFLAWHTVRGDQLEMPVPSERVVAYVESLPPSLGPNGIKLRMAAIAKHHGEQHLLSPTAYAAMRTALRRRQTVGEAVLAPAGGLRRGPSRPVRNRALLLLIRVGGLAPAEVAELDREDLRFSEG